MPTSKKKKVNNTNPLIKSLRHILQSIATFPAAINAEQKISLEQVCQTRLSPRSKLNIVYEITGHITKNQSAVSQKRKSVY